MKCNNCGWNKLTLPLPDLPYLLNELLVVSLWENKLGIISDYIKSLGSFEIYGLNYLN